eukprot:7376947-Prymnesium_polylepis.2
MGCPRTCNSSACSGSTRSGGGSALACRASACRASSTRSASTRSASTPSASTRSASTRSASSISASARRSAKMASNLSIIETTHLSSSLAMAGREDAYSSASSPSPSLSNAESSSCVSDPTCRRTRFLDMGKGNSGARVPTSLGSDKLRLCYSGSPDRKRAWKGCH